MLLTYVSYTERNIYPVIYIAYKGVQIYASNSLARAGTATGARIEEQDAERGAGSLFLVKWAGRYVCGA